MKEEAATDLFVGFLRFLYTTNNPSDRVLCVTRARCALARGATQITRNASEPGQPSQRFCFCLSAERSAPLHQANNRLARPRCPRRRRWRRHALRLLRRERLACRCCFSSSASFSCRPALTPCRSSSTARPTARAPSRPRCSLRATATRDSPPSSAPRPTGRRGRRSSGSMIPLRARACPAPLQRSCRAGNARRFGTMTTLPRFSGPCWTRHPAAPRANSNRRRLRC